jgi:polyribonucleotide nucleotidyltransferase
MAGRSANSSKEFAELEYHTMRDSVLKTKIRIDGRKLDDVRPITVRVGVLPRTHGSALFTRGETQALVVATLGTTRDAQIIDAPEGESKDPFLFHYNFPPFSVGEAGRMVRRSAAKSATAVSPSAACRPSSRASKNSRTCCAWSPRSPSRTAPRRWHRSAASLALMDAGVPLKAPVAGIAMGLVKEGDATSSCCPTSSATKITSATWTSRSPVAPMACHALQMDIKIDGITEEIMKVALEQAKRGRLHILGEMAKVLTRRVRK